MPKVIDGSLNRRTNLETQSFFVDFISAHTVQSIGSDVSTNECQEFPEGKKGSVVTPLHGLATRECQYINFTATACLVLFVIRS